MLILYCEAQGKDRIWSTFDITAYYRVLNLNLKSINTLFLFLMSTACLHIRLIHESPATCSHFCLCVTSLKSYKTFL